MLNWARIKSPQNSFPHDISLISLSNPYLDLHSPRFWGMSSHDFGGTVRVLENVFYNVRRIKRWIDSRELWPSVYDFL